MKRPDTPNEARQTTWGDCMGKILQSLPLSVVTGLVLTVVVALVAPLIAG